MQRQNFIKALMCVTLGLVALSTSGCLGSNYPKDFRTDKTNQTNATGTMKPYTVNGKTYYPTVVGVGETATGVASWYGPGFHGKTTSNGETYNQNAFTAAHKTLPMNTILSVTNLDNGRKTTVRVNDRGPFKDNRIIDLSKAAATRLDMLQTGTAPVKLEVIGFDSSNQSSANAITPTLPDANVLVDANVNEGLGTNASESTNEQNASKIGGVSVSEFISENQVQGGGFMVQIGAFKVKENAEEIAEHYKNYKGYTTKTRVSARDGLMRVFLRGFRSEAEAKDFVRSGAFKGAFVVRE